MMLIDPVVEKLDDVYRSKSFEPMNVVPNHDGIDITTLRHIAATTNQFNNIFNVRSSMVQYPFESFSLEDGRTVYPRLTGVWLLPTDAPPNQDASFMAMLDICENWKTIRSELMTITYKGGELTITESVNTDNPGIDRKILSEDFQYFTQLVYQFVDYCKNYWLCKTFKVKFSLKEKGALNVAGYLKHPKVKGPGVYSIEIHQE